MTVPLRVLPCHTFLSLCSPSSSLFLIVVSLSLSRSCSFPFLSLSCRYADGPQQWRLSRRRKSGRREQPSRGSLRRAHCCLSGALVSPSSTSLTLHRALARPPSTTRYLTLHRAVPRLSPLYCAALHHPPPRLPCTQAFESSCTSHFHHLKCLRALAPRISTHLSHVHSHCAALHHPHSFLVLPPSISALKLSTRISFVELVGSEGRQHCAAVLPTSMAGVPLLLASHFRVH
jgi:hypothetical protein